MPVRYRTPLSAGPPTRPRRARIIQSKEYSSGIGKVKALKRGGGDSAGGGGGDGGCGGGAGAMRLAASFSSDSVAATSRSIQTHLPPCMKTPPSSRFGIVVAYEPCQAATPRVPQHEAHWYREMRWLQVLQRPTSRALKMSVAL